MIAGFGHGVLSILGFFLESSKNISIFSGLECKNKYEIIFPRPDLILTNMRAELCLCQTSKSLNQFFAVDIDDNNYLMYYQVRTCNVQ